MQITDDGKKDKQGKYRSDAFKLIDDEDYCDDANYVHPDLVKNLVPLTGLAIKEKEVEKGKHPFTSGNPRDIHETKQRQHEIVDRCYKDTRTFLEANFNTYKSHAISDAIREKIAERTAIRSTSNETRGGRSE